MTQTTVLAAGDTAANSSDITVASGSNVTISLFLSQLIFHFPLL